MAVSMYAISVPILLRHLTGLAIVTGKAQALYREKKLDEASLLSYRFYPDMYSFTGQIRSATNNAGKGIALLAGIEPPKHADDEKTLADLLARIAKTKTYLESIQPDQVNGTEDKEVVIKGPDRELKFKGFELLQNRTLPNFYFHCTTAFDILRHNGLEIGKRHFMGNDD